MWDSHRFIPGRWSFSVWSSSSSKGSSLHFQTSLFNSLMQTNMWTLVRHCAGYLILFVLRIRYFWHPSFQMNNWTEAHRGSITCLSLYTQQWLEQGLKSTIWLQSCVLDLPDILIDSYSFTCWGKKKKCKFSFLWQFFKYFQRLCMCPSPTPHPTLFPAPQILSNIPPKTNFSELPPSWSPLRALFCVDDFPKMELTALL